METDGSGTERYLPTEYGLYSFKIDLKFAMGSETFFELARGFGFVFCLLCK